jgi:hypothetical protein
VPFNINPDLLPAPQGYFLVHSPRAAVVTTITPFEAAMGANFSLVDPPAEEKGDIDRLVK